jgi:hypothetical protein
LVDKIVPTDFVVKAASWVLGEIGSSYYSDDSEKLSELFNRLKNWMEFDLQKESSKKWIVDAIMKLSSAKEFKVHAEVKIMLDKYSRHTDLELYQRILCNNYYM